VCIHRNRVREAALRTARTPEAQSGARERQKIVRPRSFILLRKTSSRERKKSPSRAAGSSRLLVHFVMEGRTLERIWTCLDRRTAGKPPKNW
jgi:hypothetical protein